MAGKSALPLLMLAGAAVVLAGKKKKKKSSGTYDGADYESFVVPPTPSPPEATKTSGPSGKTAGSEIWKQRQTALAFVAGMKVCNCHPGAVDGLYGPATINAIIAFQICAGIDVDGKWSPQTDASMKKMLTEIAQGQVKIPAPKPKDKTSSDAHWPLTWECSKNDVDEIIEVIREKAVSGSGDENLVFTALTLLRNKCRTSMPPEISQLLRYVLDRAYDNCVTEWVKVVSEKWMMDAIEKDASFLAFRLGTSDAEMCRRTTSSNRYDLAIYLLHISNHPQAAQQVLEIRKQKWGWKSGWNQIFTVNVSNG